MSSWLEKYLSPKAEYLRAGGGYLIVLLLIFGYFLFEPGSLYCRVTRDFWHLYNSLPEFDLSHRLMFHFRHFPLWNFLNGFGVPLLADLQSAPFHPARLLFLLPFWKVIDIWLLMRLLISAMFTFVYLRRRGIGFEGALFGGLAWMLTGSLTDYINMHYLDVDLLLPIGLLTFEAMARRAGISPVLLSTIVVVFAFLGGNPTSILYLLIFFTFYYFYILYYFREDLIGGYFRFFAVAGLSALLTAVLLIPFREYLAFAWNYHPEGVGAMSLSPKNIAAVLGPEVFGKGAEGFIPLAQRIPYFGVLPVMLAFLSVLCLRRMNSHATFFTAYACASLGIIFGVLPYHLISYLPLLIRTSNFRYAVPEAAFCFAVLAGMGLDHLVRWREAVWRILVAPSLITAGLFSLAFSEVIGKPLLPVNGTALLLLTAFAWFITAVIFFHRRRTIKHEFIGYLMCALWAGEAAVHVHSQKLLAPPNPKFFTSLPQGIDHRTLMEGRIYTSAEIFYPNLNILHGIMDVRYLGALYPKRYELFMRTLNNSTELELLYDFLPYNFIGINWNTINSPLVDLTGITTIVSDVTIPPAKFVSYVFQHADLTAPSANHIALKKFSINSDTRASLYQHPPSAMSAQSSPGFLLFGIGIESSEKSADSDGVTFIVYRLKEDGDREMLFVRHLNPATVAGEKAWLDYVVPVKGGEVIFQTIPGMDDKNDWSAWGDLRSSTEEISRYNLVQFVPYKVYENGSSLLGAFMAERVRVSPSMEESARLLQSLDFRKEVVVEGKDAHNLKMSIGSQENYNINLTRELGDAVKIFARVENNGVLVLTDTYYPGWRAFVDGKETKIFPADVAFRAVALRKGEHSVEFLYLPLSFKIGLWSTLMSFAMLVWAANKTTERRKNSFRNTT